MLYLDTMLAGATETTGLIGLGCTIVESVMSDTSRQAPGMTTERIGLVLSAGPPYALGRRGAKPVRPSRFESSQGPLSLICCISGSQCATPSTQVPILLSFSRLRCDLLCCGRLAVFLFQKEA